VRITPFWRITLRQSRDVRRAVDVLLLAAVAVVVGAAVVDASSPSEADRAADATAEAAAELRAAHVGGRLVVAAPDCSRRELVLPSLREKPLGVIACSVYGRPGSLAVYRGGIVWYAFAGGTTTLLRGRELDAYLGRHARLRRVAWLGNVRYAASYRISGAPGETLALFEGGTLVRVIGRNEAYEDVRSSPSGGFLAARSSGGLALYDALGNRIALPRDVAAARALAWSPNERWTVAAGADGLAVFRTRSTRVVATVPFPGVDVDWTD
jgi:hypothetical protein